MKATVVGMGFLQQQLWSLKLGITFSFWIVTVIADSISNFEEANIERNSFFIHQSTLEEANLSYY